jgi:rfaE bifunctional protein nucleotidyltransferase chain/domain
MIVLANGVFDVLHVGHVEHLEEARKMGTRLIVSLTADESVNKGPGRPLYKWADRASVLRALRCVSEVIQTYSAVQAIRRVQPDIFCKGIDYAGMDRFTEDVVAACREVGAAIRFTSAPKQSVTEIIKRTAAL